jgi:1-acyl-sn-glycerol-3-phosphate acyltransferase
LIRPRPSARPGFLAGGGLIRPRQEHRPAAADGRTPGDAKACVSCDRHGGGERSGSDVTLRLDAKQPASRFERADDLGKEARRVRHLVDHVEREGDVDTARQVRDVQAVRLRKTGIDAIEQTRLGGPPSETCEHPLLYVHGNDASPRAHHAGKVEGEKPHSAPRLEHEHALADEWRQRFDRVLPEAAEGADEPVAEPPWANVMGHESPSPASRSRPRCILPEDPSGRTAPSVAFLVPGGTVCRRRSRVRATGVTLAAVNAEPLVPQAGAVPPHRGNRVSRALARWALHRARWRLAGTFPAVPKAVIVVAPHTSNWDFPLGILVMFAVGLRIGWLGKHTLFWWPLGPVMKWLDGIPVRRDESSGTVAEIVARFHQRSRMLLALSPEGTRKAVTKWRMGFAHIAKGAGVPVVPVAFDWGRREVRFGPPFELTGTLAEGEMALRSWFAGVTGRNPGQAY